MPLYPPKTESNFKAAPAGSHLAVLVDVVDKGMMETTYKNQTKIQPKVMFLWQLSKRINDPEHPAHGKRYLVPKMYTFSASEKSNLYADFLSWTGSALTETFDVDSLVGKNAILSITNNPSNGKVYANIMAVSPLIEGMNEIAPEDYTRKVNRPMTTGEVSDAMDHMEPPPHSDSDAPSDFGFPGDDPALNF